MRDAVSLHEYILSVAVLFLNNQFHMCLSLRILHHNLMTSQSPSHLHAAMIVVKHSNILNIVKQQLSL